jgi:hypothetical protein
LKAAYCLARNTTQSQCTYVRFLTRSECGVMGFIEFNVIQIGEPLETLVQCLEGHGIEVHGNIHRAVQVGDILELHGDRGRVLRELEGCNSDWHQYLSPR